ncbi:MAG: DEAD/DEAH box helicase [Armatimonadetes bacterium]|nr:DEAD/DEAH box helicase [Armatimonadota bacterium]
MDFDGYLEDLKKASFYRGQIIHVQTIPPQPAQYGTLESPLHPTLQDCLDKLEIRDLYSHQATAINEARSGNHVTVVTATASGKTLCYNLPVLDNLLNESGGRAFYLFPTKALAQDQLGKLDDFGLFPTIRHATYDGDTSASDRRYVKRGAHIVLTNPDMLHVGILPYHTTWSAFLANLKYVVVDELHTYRGVFGAHVASVFHRLRRLCAVYGANPQFLCCSATVANPVELTERLTGITAPMVVDNNGAPTGKRYFVFWNPPLLDAEQSRRRSAHTEATNLFTNLVARGVRNITFAKARKSAELILRYARNEFQTSAPHLLPRITSYRSGYTKEERRAIEQGLFEGKIIGVTATNALELGIDVGGLDATVITGYPGSIASTWQQAGRAGRRGAQALSILIGMDNPLDQFLMRHPEYFFGKAHEKGVVDPNNRRILEQHLLCAAYERPLSKGDMIRFGKNAEAATHNLLEQDKIFYRQERYHFRGGGYPARTVNIRSTGDSVYRILNRALGDKFLGTVEGSIAFKTLHEGAIYLHLGETYEVEELNITGKTAYVFPTEGQHYTEPRENAHILILNTLQSRGMGETQAHFGEVVVTNQVVGYRKKRLFSDEVLEVTDLDLPEQTFETEAFWFTIPDKLMLEFVFKGGDLGGSIHAIEHAIIGMMPLMATCDRWDLGGVSHTNHPDTASPTIFVYDAYSGGVGIAEATYPTLQLLLRATQQMIAECPCAEGCPSCVQSPKCGNNNQPLDKHGANELLDILLRDTA